MAKGTDFLVQKSNIHEQEFRSTNLLPIGDGEVRLAIDHFAFTANNITYAALGDMMKYWQFFPASDGFGRIPVWGFADVMESNHPKVEVGERFYGYYPMSTHLTVRPARVLPTGFMDASEHRKDLAAIYNQYVSTKNDPGYHENMEELQMIFRPLFMTSFLIDDFLEDNDFFGAKQIILSSASSKTAFGAAFQLAKRSNIEVIGLTSAKNVEFVKQLGCYDQVVTYDEVAKLDTAQKSAYVDMAGSGKVRSDIHNKFADKLVYSCAVGASHWDDMGSNEDLPGAKPTMFFAPSQGQKRMKEWGPRAFQAKSAEAWLSFIKPASGWIDIKHHKGENAIQAIYLDMLNGRTNPRDGHILSF